MRHSLVAGRRGVVIARLGVCILLALGLLVLSVPLSRVLAEEGSGEQVVSNSDDLDGDEVEDVVVADPEQGKVDIISGADDDDAITMMANNPGDQFGYSVAVLDDGDNNGIKDLLVGAPFEEAGKAYLFSETFEVSPLSPVPANDADMIFISPDAVDYEFGERVAPVSDLDGDGIQDIRIRAWFLDEDDVETMHTYIISSATGLGMYVVTGDEPFDPWQDVPGDVDGDGDVDEDDIDTIIKNINAQPENPTQFDGDLNADGVVDAADLALRRAISEPMHLR